MNDRRKQAIIEMAKRGTIEEQKIANSIIEKLSISVEDEKIIDAVFKYRDKYEKRILMQVWAMVINKDGVSYFTNPKKKNTVIFEVTKSQESEIELFYSTYKREIKEELDLTLSAFIHKNNIFPQTNIDNPRTEITQEDRDRVKKMFDRMGTMDKMQIRKQIV